MPYKIILTLLISIAVHAVLVVALDNDATTKRNTSSGSIQAPVSLTFSRVTQSLTPTKEKPVIEKVVEKTEPKTVVVKKTPPKAKPVLKKKKPVKKTPEPKKAPPKAIAQTPAPAKQTQVAEEQTSKRTVTKKSEAPGFSDEPVMVSEPTIQHLVEPRYPKLAKRRNQQGVVLLDVIVDEHGMPMTVDVLESSGYPILDRAAIGAVKRWSFKPKQRNHRFVKSRVHIPVTFKIS